MERNADNLGGQTSGQGSTTGGGASYGASGGSAGGYGATGGSGGSAFGEGGAGTAGEQARGAFDRAGDEGQGRMGQVKDKAGQAAGAVREKAGDLKSTLADKLQQGAERLRARGETGTGTGTSASTGGYVGATGEGSVSVGQNRLGHLTESLAGGMQNTADWLRDADLDGVRTGVERQVKEHPGRTLLIALGVGYLLGKAFRK